MKLVTDDNKNTELQALFSSWSKYFSTVPSFKDFESYMDKIIC